jgi:hypothetical protein
MCLRKQLGPTHRPEKQQNRTANSNQANLYSGKILVARQSSWVACAPAEKLGPAGVSCKREVRISCMGAKKLVREIYAGRPVRRLPAHEVDPVGPRGNVLFVPAFGVGQKLSKISSPAGDSMQRLRKDRSAINGDAGFMRESFRGALTPDLSLPFADLSRFLFSGGDRAAGTPDDK